MKFDELFPNMRTQYDEEYFEGTIIFRAESHGECLVCGEATTYLDLAAERYCCSEECNHGYWGNVVDFMWNSSREGEEKTINWKKEGF